MGHRLNQVILNEGVKAQGTNKADAPLGPIEWNHPPTAVRALHLDGI